MQRLSDTALKRLEDARARSDELARELSDPTTFEDARRAAELSREHAELADIADRFGQYTELVARLDEAEELLRDGADEDMQALAREEVAEVEPRITEVVDSLHEFLRPRDPNDVRDVILEIRGAEGGQEANLWAADLMRMYMKYAEVKSWKVEVLNTSETDLGGVKEVIFELHGRGAYSRLKYEGGGHRVQRVPETEAQGRIHTSAATVSVLPKAEEVDVQIRDDDLRVDVYRSGGHGGQGVNTTDSAVRLTHLPTGLVVTCQDERSQLKNKARAMDVLRSRLFEMELRRQQEEVGSARRSQVGSGERGSKIRTYNFRENRVTDHRIGLTLYNLDRVLEGQLDPLIDALAEADAVANEEASV
ncbi:MAG: peptide chain release factor 1 [Chloroflexi bacterium]|nr:peptide chain release factor 1 [Chloroflexota bacterium]MBV9596515.1 peptide chain release factor 1 [Chloroflexota bacterium]